MKLNRIILVFCSGLLLYACQNIDESTDLSQQKFEEEIVYRNLDLPAIDVKSLNENARLAPSKYKAKLYMAEYITAPESEEMGRTVIFDNKGSKKLSIDFSPFEKLYETPDMSYYVDEFRASSSVDVATATAAIDRAAQTWDEVTCSELGLTKIDAIPLPIGIIANILGFPSIDGAIADVEHLGFMPAEFFDFLAPGGSNFILGVTFTLIWIDDEGNPIDTNGDGKIDAAVREIYYNDNFPWADGATFDVETVALHEMGHGLSQAHFGTAFIKKNGTVQFSPRAVMNASYSGVQTEIGKTDNAGHCSIWANWPNK
ncbi:hypothetical protein [Algoriphagus sp.]|uniref:hypothetical protein n=1 Tax=Algoriphagus sp. TaxID=1872435 RepID=UPI0025F8F1A1|nr:hypothetical protein [Algoriphagus sp.]